MMKRRFSSLLGMLVMGLIPLLSLAKGAEGGGAPSVPCPALTRLLQDSLFRTSEVGLTVYDLTADSLLFRYRDEKWARPASVQKVMTGVAALAVLGEEYVFRTSLFKATSEGEDGPHAHWRLVGGMDPLFSEEQLNALAAAMGTDDAPLAADLSLKDSVAWGPGWSWDDAPFSFQPEISPLMVNEGCVQVTVRPSAKDSLPTVEVSPASAYCQVVNRAVSHQPQAGKLRVTRNWMTGGNTLVVEGNADRVTRQTLTVARPHAFFIYMLNERRGKTTASPLFSVETPLKKVLTRALKKSDNLCAEAMFFHVGRHFAKENRPLHWEDASEALITFAQDSLGIAPNAHRIVDGSGVSLYDYTTPAILLEYLKWAYRRPAWFPTFYDALPVAGVDGTLAGRMKRTRAEGNVHAKTGSVTGVSSLAGYVTASNGHLLAFVILNQQVAKLADARKWQDKVCAALAE